jgi:uncharacterized protein YkwD
MPLSSAVHARKVHPVLDRHAGRWPPARVLLVLVLACLAPLPVAVATGLAQVPDDERTETLAGEAAARRRDGDGPALVGDVPLGGVVGPVDGVDAGDPLSEAAGSSTTTPRASSTTAPTVDLTPAAPPAEDPAPAPPTSAASPPADGGTTSSPSPPTVVIALSLAEDVVVRVNAARAEAGCEPLVVDARLVTVAQAHSEDMAAQDYFDHTSLDGTTFAERLLAAGYSGGGENIARGQRSAAEVHEAWMESPGHRRNILDCSFAAVGVGVETSTWTWTEDFGV